MLRITLFLVLLAGCNGGFADPGREFADPVPEDARLHPVVIDTPASLGVADTPLRDPRGRVVGVACKTCHGPTKKASLANQADEVLHGDIELVHGPLTCNHCHSEDRTKLELANDERIDFGDTMVLCAQCHGVQYRDYRNGSHGGMTGYWDLRQGPRSRNHCVHCHHPHSPALEPVLPLHPPRDRYLEVSKGGH